jgi:hypothetical protein
MAKVAEARVDITGKDKTKQAFTAVQGRLARLKGSLVSVKGAMSLVIGAGFIHMGKEALKSADAIGKFSDRAGVTTAKLQKMRFAFDLAGVGVEAVDKAFLTFGKRLGKAHQGIGALVGGLKGGEEQLLENLKATSSTSEAMDVMFKAMGAAETQTRKLAIADAAFGMAGLRMTAAFRDGSKAFFEAQKRAEDLGLVLRDDLIRDAEKLNDDLTVTTKILQMQLIPAFLGLAGSMSSALDYLTILITRFNSFKENFSSSNPVSGMEQAFRSLAITIDDVGIALSKLMRNKDMENAFKKNRDASLKILAEGRRASKNDGSMTLSTTPSGRSGSLSDTSLSAPSGITGLLDTLDMEKLLDREFAKGLAEQASIKEKGENLKRYIKQINFEKELTKERMEGEEQVARLMEIQNELGVSLNLRYTEEKKQIIEIMAEHKKYTEQLEFQNKIVGIGERVFDRAGDGILRAMQRGENAMESFRNVAMSVLFDVQREMFKLMLFEPLKKSLFSIGSDLFSGFSFGGGKASGGNVSANRSYMVGERGAEMFTPSSSGFITPNNELAGAGGVNITLNLSTGVQSTVRAEVMGMLPMISENVKHAVSDARLRGGSFSKAMGL